MGYLSEVSITVPNEAFEELLAMAKAENNHAYELIKCAAIYQTDRFTTIHFDEIKWYRHYEDVRFIESFVHKVPYVFKRIGEESDDIECDEGNNTDYGIYDCVNIVRSLDVENAGEEITIYGEGEDVHEIQRQAA